MDVIRTHSITIIGNTHKDCWDQFDSFKKEHVIIQTFGAQKDETGHYQMLVIYCDYKKEEDKSKYILCDKSENIEESLKSWIDKPVYIKGCCWGKEFDGWTILYLDEKEERNWLGHLNLWFDYKGKQYSVYGFLPSKYTYWTSSDYDNAIYSCKV